MQYDPVKDRVSELIRLFPLARSIFYALLDRVLLRQRYVKSMIVKYAPSSGKFSFYDAGAGFCQYSAFVMRRWHLARVFATDLKADYLSDFAFVASKDFPERFSYCQADLQFHIPQNRYDMAVAIDILEHIEDDVAAIKNIHACLNPAGHLIISTPSDTDEAAKFTEEHVRPGYAKMELENKLTNAGFEIIESIYSYGIWGALAWRLLIKHPLSLLKHGKLMLILLAPYLMMCYPLCELLMQMDIRRQNKSGTGIVIVARKPA